jgi:hypothetical protein
LNNQCAPINSRAKITGFLSKNEGLSRSMGGFAFQIPSFRRSDQDSIEIPFISKIRGVVMSFVNPLKAII